MSSSFSNVTIAGGTGTLGYSITEAFLNDGSYNVKVLRKKPKSESEKADLLASKGAEIVYADYSQKDDLVNALKGTDVLISTLSPSDNIFFCDNQSLMLTAAKEASVKRFIPSEFGSGFESGFHKVTDDKYKSREETEKSGLEYTFIHNGLFQEFLPWLGFDIKNKKATFYCDGSTRLSTTSLHDIGKYTVECLKLPESRNATIHVAGTTLSLQEYLQKFEEVTGSKWEVTEEKDVRNRFKNKIDPVPSELEDFIALVAGNTEFKKVDNDKFSFTPRPIEETISALVKKAQA